MLLVLMAMGSFNEYCLLTQLSTGLGIRVSVGVFEKPV